MLSTLAYALQMAERGGRGLAAFNVFGYEDAAAVVHAAEKQARPVALMANKDAVAHMGIPVLACILRHVAQEAEVPVCVHLDHATELGTIQEAIAHGFTSVMFDGSQLTFEKNAELTCKVLDMAGPAGVSVEAEIGAVGYSDPSLVFKPRYTEPEEAEAFYRAAPVDALAVAVGTVHRMVAQEAALQFQRLKAIHTLVKVPLVIHGATGVPDQDLGKLVRCGAGKINLGTTLRLAFGRELRRQILDNPEEYDRIKLFGPCMEAVEEKAAQKLRLI